MSEMGEVFINITKTVALTGHRYVPKSFNNVIVKTTFEKLINDGYDTFLTGMAVGFDTLAVNVLLELKKKYNIKIVACIPCDNQAYNFTLKQKDEYEYLLSVVDEKIYVSHNYSAYCMHKRNRFMVDNSSVLVAYVRQNSGGAVNTVKYAQSKNVKVVFI